MKFPIEFMKDEGAYNYLPFIVNLAGNSVVAIASGATLYKISAAAFKSLGIESIPVELKVIPVSLELFGVVGAVVTVGILAFVAKNFKLQN